MTDIVFSPYLFLRTPALSYEQNNEKILRDMLGGEFLRSAIYFASESFYMVLSAKNFDYNSLDEKARFTLQKYFNRMCCRPTPFGMFSAFSSLNWAGAGETAATIITTGEEVYVNLDFQLTTELSRKMEASGVFKSVRYFTNHTIYSTKGAKRYLTDRFNEKQKKIEYFINSFESNRMLNRLLAFSQKGKTRDELGDWLSGYVQDRAEAANYISDLIDGGLLVSELYPNMTGPKYFDRIVEIVRKAGIQDALTDGILYYEKQLADAKSGHIFARQPWVESAHRTGGNNKNKSAFYVGTGRTVRGTLDVKYQEIIKEGLFCLEKISARGQPKPLSNFASKFRARFEDQEAPLLVALDREAGVGYEGLEANIVPSELLEGVQLEVQSNVLNFNWTPVHELFLAKLPATKHDQTINITPPDLQKLKDDSGLKMPPGFSVVFRPYKDKIWIEQAGGCTGTALLGRFSLFNEEIRRESIQIAEAEQNPNPDVIFAEISCFNDEHAANINSNAGIRVYEIPIGVHSTYPPENIIGLSDLFVSVINNQVLLRSKKHNKIVIPRLSSAFNYSRSELAVFRFLCDLQFQGLKFNYSFDLRALLPGLHFYPRVEYGQCILYPATWILSPQEISELSVQSGMNNFSGIASKIGLKRKFALTEGDNQLVFDSENERSVMLFIKTIITRKEAVLTEVFEDDDSKVKDKSGNGYVAQFIATVFSAAKTYPPAPLPGTVLRPSGLKRFYLPGDEWLYFKIYCHPSAANSVLLEDIAKIIKQLKKNDLMKSWFFIRYADPDKHLRIRVKIVPGNETTVIQYFGRRMRRLMERGTISNMLMDTYQREIERYGEKTMEYAEAVFQSSSELIAGFLGTLNSHNSEVREFQFAIISVDALVGIYFADEKLKIRLMRQMYDGMRHEFSDARELRVQLDNKYREYSVFFNNLEKATPAMIGQIGKARFKAYTAAIASIHLIYKNAPQVVLMKLAGDLIHMHLNRLFSDKQRDHEFVIYYLLQKYYTSAEARRNKSALSFSPTFKSF